MAKGWRRTPRPVWGCGRCASGPLSWAAEPRWAHGPAAGRTSRCSCLCTPGTTMAEPVRVLVVDDHPVFRDGLRTMLAATDDFEMVGEAESGEGAAELADRESVDVVLLDIHMPGISGIEVAEQITTASPHIRILMLTMFEDDASVFGALRVGARGYLLKSAGREELLRALRAVADGEAIFSPNIATRVLDFFAQGHPAHP